MGSNLHSAVYGLVSSHDAMSYVAILAEKTPGTHPHSVYVDMRFVCVARWKLTSCLNSVVYGLVRSHDAIV